MTPTVQTRATRGVCRARVHPSRDAAREASRVANGATRVKKINSSARARASARVASRARERATTARPEPPPYRDATTMTTAFALEDGIDGYVFDCDGTLIDTMGIFYAADARACAERGVTMSKKMFYDLAGVPLRDIVRRLCVEQGVAHDEAFLDDCLRACAAYAREMGTPERIECVCDVARAARRAGKKVAVASSGARETVTRHLAERELLDLFDFVVCVEDVARGKPAPDLYVAAARGLGVDASRCVAFEDADLGMESARAAGYARVVDVRKFSEYHPRDYLCESEP